MRGYIVYPTYRIIDGRPVVILFGRMEDGKPFEARVPFRPYFFIPEKDLKKAQKAFETEHEKTSLNDFDGRPVVKIFADKPSDVPTIRKAYEDEGITSYESDIRFVQRFYMDNGIRGTIDISGTPEDGTYNNAKIKAAGPYDVKLRTLSFDIETDKRAAKIYSIAISCGQAREVHIVSKKKIRNAVSYDSEKELLLGFISRLKELDPDIITGWSVIDFDLNVIHRRLKSYSIPFAIGRTDDECSIKVQRDFFRESSATVPGRIVFDAISLLKQAWLTFRDYKLDTVAKELLGDRKVRVSDDFWDDFEETIKNRPEKVAEYNLKDADLVIEILNKKKLIELMLKKSLITGMQLDRVRGSIASLDSLYIRKARKRGYVCPNSAFGERGERIKGAFVMNPKPGIYDYIVVLDFKSLYPSIIRTYNIDPISHRKGGDIIAPNGARFENSEGILPEIIMELGKERDIAKKEKDDTKSYAIKIIMNSFYGALANPFCRFYSLEMGNAITSFARQTIKETASLIREKGYEVIYGDTDSVFVDLKSGSEKDAAAAGAKIADHVNRHFSAQVRTRYGRRSWLELEFEKVFKVLMLPRMRSSEAGAKKRYAGLLIKDGKEEITVTGMELVRRDWTELAKVIQKELLDRVFHKKEVADYLKKVVDEMRTGKHDDMLVYRKSIRKGLSEYTKTTPPHVKAARMLPKLTSNIIEYYMTMDGPQPVEIAKKRKSRLDYEHYLDKQIRPVAESILNLYGKTFEEIVKDSKQSNLFDY